MNRVSSEPTASTTPWRSKLHEIIFEADTPAGKAFDVALITCVLLSVLCVMLESVQAIRAEYGGVLLALEWAFTLLFSLEYALRILSVGRPRQYVTSFFGIVDLLAILPTFLSFIFPGAQSLLVIRGFRLIRIFRIFKLSNHLGQADLLYRALRLSGPKITVFLTAIFATVIIVGTLMYIVEGEAHGFTNIPKSIYWAIVTMTTVGYGDIAPGTPLGQTIASALMISGYGIIAVPTGIMTSELVRASRVDNRACMVCSREGHDPDAKHCKHCGAKL